MRSPNQPPARRTAHLGLAAAALAAGLGSAPLAHATLLRANVRITGHAPGEAGSVVTHDERVSTGVTPVTAASEQNRGGAWATPLAGGGQIIERSLGVAAASFARPGQLSVGARTNVQGDRIGFNASGFTEVQAIYNDVITVQGGSPGQMAVLHINMHLVGGGEHFENPVARNGIISAQDGAELHIDGSGVPTGPFGGPVYGIADFGGTPGALRNVDTGNPSLIPVAIQVQIGVPTPIFFNLQAFGNAAFLAGGEFGEGMLNSTVPKAFIQYGYDLQWGDQTWVTTTGGNLLGGLSIASDSNFDFHLGEFTPEGLGGVPEPATWSLMITGLGLAGLSLRRRRALQAT